ncbi:MAG: hypothetical protein NC517_07500 [Firmicutes bacterium]|nr:hypothetical protein [Bacillota bacterium]
MFGKNKGIIAVLVGVMLLCLLSACTADGNSTDNESQKENASAEQGFSSEDLPSETDGPGSQAAEEDKPSETEGTGEQVAEEDKPSGMEDMYKAVLLGEDFINVDHKEDRKLNIENIKEVVSDEDWVTARVKKFTIIDLDGNGENEIVLWIEANDDLDYGFEILYYKDQEVYGFTLPARGFEEPKADGTFDYLGGIGYSGTGRLQFSKGGYAIGDVWDSESQVNKPDLGWYDLTPESVELAFENRFENRK